MLDTKAMTGILDPGYPDRWLVPPWPVHASFGDVVHHFLTIFVWPLLGDKNVPRQLAYFEGYQAALTAASTDDLHYTVDFQWRDELLRRVAEAVAIYRTEAAEQQLTAANVDAGQRAPGLLRASDLRV